MTEHFYIWRSQSTTHILVNIAYTVSQVDVTSSDVHMRAPAAASQSVVEAVYGCPRKQ
jgi:hypothetical protein